MQPSRLGDTWITGEGVLFCFCFFFGFFGDRFFRLELRPETSDSKAEEKINSVLSNQTRICLQPPRIQPSEGQRSARPASASCCSLVAFCCLILTYNAAIEIAFRYEESSSPPVLKLTMSSHLPPPPLGQVWFSDLQLTSHSAQSVNKQYKENNIQYCQLHCGYHIYKIKNQIL